MTEDSFELRPGSVVERCRVVQALGSWSYGTVYEARESPVGARVAICMLGRAALSTADAHARFEQWFRALGALRHPHLAELRAVGSHGEVPYFIAELPDAETLHAKLQRVGALPLLALADMMLPLASVVAASHRLGAMMRVTPYGVFLTQGDDGAATPRVLRPAISDALAGGGLAGPNAVPLALLPFLSPEAARGARTLDVTSDVWSLGAVLYTAFAGRRPYEESTHQATLAAMLTRPPAPLRERVPRCPEAFEALVARALALDPAARFASAGDLGRALLPFASVRARARWATEFGADPTASEQPRHVSTRPPPAMPAPGLSPLAPAALTQETRRSQLRRVPMFATLPAADVENLLACVRWRALAPGEMLYRQGEAGDSMAFVAEGAVSVYAERGDAQHEIARLGVGSILGEMACLDPAPRSASVVAAEPVVVGELSRDGLAALTEHAPAIAALLVGEVIQHVAAKIREVEDRIDVVLSPASVPPSGPPGQRRSSRPPRTSPPDALDPAATAAPPPPTGVARFMDFLRRIT